jgi:uroporphyrinogen-III synthase
MHTPRVKRFVSPERAVEKYRFARRLRNHATPAERQLWCHLRTRRCAGLKFRRQSPILGWIVDFYCPKLRIVVEVDGGYHDEPRQREADDYRDGVMRRAGLLVLRFSNARVLTDTARVLDEIAAAAGAR